MERRSRDVPYSIGDPGRLAAEVRVGQPLAFTAGADIELAEYEVRGVEIRAASTRGLSHRQRGTERQDAFACAWDEERGQLLIAVADGVGSKAGSRFASTTAVRTATEVWTRSTTDLGDLLRQVNDVLLQSIPLTESGFTSGATTLSLVALELDAGQLGEANIAWIGDTPVWVLNEGEWSEEAGPEDATDGFDAPISALPATRPEVHRATIPAGARSIFVMTDGVGNALRNSAEARDALAEWWAEPPSIYSFGAQVDFARKSFVDDRSVVGVWSVGALADPHDHELIIGDEVVAEPGTE